MDSLARRLDESTSWPDASLPADSWLPPEAPLALPRQALHADRAPGAPETSPGDIARRRLLVFGGATLVTVLVAAGPFVLFAREGFERLEMVGFAAFVMLAAALACWFCSAIAGFHALMSGHEQDDIDFSPAPAKPVTRTALLMPLYNEDAEAAFGRLAALDASLARLGVSDAYDIFVLSDTRKAAIAADEDACFRRLRHHAHSRLYLRRRAQNTERKAGNICDWVARFGAAYDFMVVLDADSTMAGETVLRLTDAMERHEGVGLIQTAPTIVGARTLYGRVSQFSVRLYGRVAAAGVAFWSGAEGSYWGHNAIVRVKAFAACAKLPVLFGEKPFGGDILSHDVVEAAMLRRAGWAVHVTAALDGSAEETPPTLLDFIRRDYRWCQGNLQHLALLGARGLHPINRLQFLMGAMAYIASPLWLITLVVGLAIQLQYPPDWGTFWYFMAPELSPFMLGTWLSAILLVGPKLMGAALVLSRPGELKAFGGSRTVMRGVIAEMAVSALLAPIQMVANTRSVLRVLRGQDAGWSAQQRDADGIGFADAWRAMAWQVATGAACAVALCFRPDLLLCFAPIFLPLLFAPAIAVYTSRRATGEAFAAQGLLVIPDEDGVSATPSVLGAIFRQPPRGYGRTLQDAVPSEMSKL